MAHTVEMRVAGRVLSIETGKLAQQANAAVMVRYGDTLVLTTATVSTQPREGIDFFPLTVDYEEKLYAAGKIPGGYIKREGRPSQEAILNARLTDRPIRPLFPKGFRNDVQIISTVFSADQENDPDILSIIGASAALSISDIPFGGPVAAVKVGLIEGELVLNPTHAELERSALELVVAGTRDAIMMVEAGALEVDEETAVRALEFAHQAIQDLVRLQDDLVQLCGKPKLAVPEAKVAGEVEQAVDTLLAGRLAEAVYRADKTEREAALDALRSEVITQLGEQFDARALISTFDARLKSEVRSAILREGRRPDSRSLAEIRPITCEVGLLPRTHGSGLFTRGQTQVLSILTLGSLREEQIIDGLLPDESKRFMHHYNFPPFSTGEVKRLGSPGRREIGHGALAERALSTMIPDEKEFPYTIRIVSEVLSSNGSTSMASVCGSTLALMDAGVPVKAPVAGVAMGLVLGEEGRYAILSDIQGIEDALGDMDFKVAGTARGITALQMDIKVKGITPAIMREALAQAREGRLFILGRMLDTIAGVRPELSRYAPRMTTIHINPEKIRTVIGPGGKMIRSIIEQSKVTSIDIEDDGSVVIGATSGDAAERAIQIITDLTREVEVGGIYTGKVTRLTSFGAFVEILPGKEGLVRISELADYRVPSVEDVVQVGDEIMVMVAEIDRMGRINLSRRAVLQGQSPAEAAARAAADRERSERSPGGRGFGRPEGRPDGGEERASRLGPRREEPRGGPPPRRPGPFGGGPSGPRRPMR